MDYGGMFMKSEGTENAISKLVDVIVEEYKTLKSDFKYQASVIEQFEHQNSLLRTSEENNAEKFARLKNLLSSKVTWSNGSPLYLSLFDPDVLKEVCGILKIEEHEVSI